MKDAPIINNVGTLTLENGIVEVNKGTSSEHGTGILNTGTLTVNGGTIKTTVVGSWGITNEGTADIKGGEFVQGQDFSIIVNAKDLTIAGGTFKNEGSVTHNSLLTNKDDVEEAKIVIEFPNKI